MRQSGHSAAVHPSQLNICTLDAGAVLAVHLLPEAASAAAACQLLPVSASLLPL